MRLVKPSHLPLGLSIEVSTCLNQDLCDALMSFTSSCVQWAAIRIRSIDIRAMFDQSLYYLFMARDCGCYQRTVVRVGGVNGNSSIEENTNDPTIASISSSVQWVDEYMIDIQNSGQIYCKSRNVSVHIWIRSVRLVYALHANIETFR
jgi:hypothetical protein